MRIGPLSQTFAVSRHLRVDAHASLLRSAGRWISTTCAIVTLTLGGANGGVPAADHSAGSPSACQLFSLPAGNNLTPAGEEKKQQSSKTVHKKNSPATDPKAVEMEFWRSVNSLGTIEGYQSYLNQYPDGTFKGLAQAEIARLQDLASAQKAADAQAREKERSEELARQEAADDAAFQTAKTLNTKEGYETYISAYPSGRHGGDAQDAERMLAAVSPFDGTWQVSVTDLLSGKPYSSLWKLAVSDNDVRVTGSWGLLTFKEGHIEENQITVTWSGGFGTTFAGKLVSPTRIEGRWTSFILSGDWYAEKQ